MRIVLSLREKLPSCSDEDLNSSASEDELHGDGWQTFVSKRTKKLAAARAAQQHQTSTLAPQRTRRRRAPGSKKKRKLKNKLLRKVMPAEDIEEFIKRVTEDLYIQKSRVPVILEEYMP